MRKAPLAHKLYNNEMVRKFPARPPENSRREEYEKKPRTGISAPRSGWRSDYQGNFRNRLLLSTLRLPKKILESCVRAKVGPSRMTLASDRPPGRQSPKAGPREIQRTLRVGVGGATGRVSRERSSRIGAVLALRAAGTLLRTRGKENLLFEQKCSACTVRGAGFCQRSSDGLGHQPAQAVGHAALVRPRPRLEARRAAT